MTSASGEKRVAGGRRRRQQHPRSRSTARNGTPCAAITRLSVYPCGRMAARELFYFPRQTVETGANWWPLCRRNEFRLDEERTVAKAKVSSNVPGPPNLCP